MLLVIVLKRAIFCLAVLSVFSVEGKRYNDFVGCFADPPAHLSLKRPPEHPNIIQTRFLLYTRSERKDPTILQYGDGRQSIIQSQFNATRNLKVIIHGYKGSGSDLGAIFGAQSLLDIDDANIILLDWTRGAGTTYSMAVANTELVGRQLALVLLDTINLGTDPRNIHVIGFSLGAHVAGCAAEVLKGKNLLLGRITGLDPASPFFRHHLFREKARKLDATDAQLVDIIHTDGSADFADGFGLLKPIGHIDFFPNGGREQPGCVDVKNSVVVTHLTDGLDRDIACSHLRAWQFFVESIQTQNQQCKFTAWPCTQGAISYAKGICFPSESRQWSQEMGYAANRGPMGIYYLATRGEQPFCGQPLRANVITSGGAPKTSGYLFLTIVHDNSTTLFKIKCTLPKKRNEWMTFYNIAAAKFQSFSESTNSIKGSIWYQALIEKTEENATKKPDFEVDSNSLVLNKLAIEDRKGNRWEYCNPSIGITEHKMNVEFHKEGCVSL